MVTIDARCCIVSSVMAGYVIGNNDDVREYVPKYWLTLLALINDVAAGAIMILLSPSS